MEIGLARRLKFTRLIAITAGTPLASSVFLSIILVCLTAGTALNLIVGVLLATLLVILVSFSYGELVSIYPSAAGNRVFLRKPLGNNAALSLSLMWVFIILGAAGVESFMVGNVLHFLFGALPAMYWAMVVLTVILVINILGVEISGNFQLLITFFVIISLVGIFSYSLIFVRPVYVNVPTGFNVVQSMTAATIAVYFYLGFGRVTTLGEEAIDYKRGIPRAMPVALALVALTFVLGSLAIFDHVPSAVLSTTYIPQIILGNYVLRGTPITLFIAIVSIVMSFGAFNAGILGASRLIYALGREGTFPRIFGNVHTRFHSPYVSLIFLYLVVLGVVFYVFSTKNYSIPILVAAGFDSFMYSLISYSAFWHNRHMDHSEIPFYIKHGGVIFIILSVAFAILGILLLLTSPPVVSLLIIFGTLAIYIFYLLRFRMMR
ncbi:MAG: APC family permease [Thermoplasmata archaeon]